MHHVCASRSFANRIAFVHDWQELVLKNHRKNQLISIVSSCFPVCLINFFACNKMAMRFRFYQGLTATACQEQFGFFVKFSWLFVNVDG